MPKGAGLNKSLRVLGSASWLRLRKICLLFERGMGKDRKPRARSLYFMAPGTRLERDRRNRSLFLFFIYLGS